MTTRGLVHRLLTEHGQTYASEVGISLRNTPAPLFQLLCASLLMSARISAKNATNAASALIEAGLTTPERMARATWQERVNVITSHGYKRYDERTSTMLGQTSELVITRYGGDLRKLREEAELERAREHELLTEFKGIGEVGADIFLREVQGIWPELYPFADARVLKAARRLGLARDEASLARLVPRREFPRLTAALIRVDLGRAYAHFAPTTSHAL